MRASHVATAIAAFLAGSAATTVLHRRAARPVPGATAGPVTDLPPVTPTVDRDAVVLPFTRPVAAAPAVGQPAASARCGDSGGRTKAGAPCAARAGAGGRCHHHPLAA